MRTELVICDKKYKPVEITFGVGIELEEMGIDIYKDFKLLKGVAAYVALVVGCELSEAVKLIEKHIAEGGDMEEITGCFMEAIRESDFFRQPATETAKKK